MKIRRHITFAISAILLAGVVSANAGQFPPPDLSTKPTEPTFGFSIFDDTMLASGFGSIPQSYIDGANDKRSSLCSTVSDEKCSDLSSFRISVIVPPCPTNYDATDVCIRSLKTADSAGVMQNATLEYEANTTRFPKDLKNKLPAGGGASVWKGASAKGGTLDYAVIIQLVINWQPGSVPKKILNDPKNPYTDKIVLGYGVQIIPVKVKLGNYYPNYYRIGRQLPAGVTKVDNDSNCLIVDDGRCAYPDTFFADQKIELSMQMDNAVTGWMFGRMKDTKVSATPLSSYTTSLTVEGSSINVPTGYAWVPLSAIDGSLALQEMDWNKQLSNNRTLGPGNVQIGRQSNHSDLFEFGSFIALKADGGALHEPNPKLKGTGMFQAVEPWLKTVGTTPTWRFQGMPPGVGSDESVAEKVFRCTVFDKTKLHGLMTTNAMAYSWSPPVLKDGFLSYKVAGAHFDTDGSVYKGTYNLSMNAESAKCIYGFTDAPIQATVSVSKEGGETTNIATELVSIDKGWMNLSANNFTFSDPTIRIKLTQEKAAARKVTITCVKGSTKKVVTGTKPACPTGYKKK
jgi:hypothetical protein